MLAFVAVAALSNLGVETTLFIAVLGAAGLAVGLALQGSLANFASGVLLVIFRPFRGGDFISIGGISGTVEEIQFFSTRLRTPDNKTVFVPNAKISGDVITNFSARDTRRLDLSVTVSYDSNLRRAKKILADILAADQRVLADPPPVIAVMELAENGVELVVRPWVKRVDLWDLRFYLLEIIKFDKTVSKYLIPGGMCIL
jgi:small conductance mechanosensitive channel